MTTTEPLHISLESEAFSCQDIEISRLTGVERISQLFQFDLEIVTSDSPPERQAMVGASASLVFEREGSEVRRIYGMISEVSEVLEREADTRVFRLRFVPHAHLLSLVESQELYLDVTVPDLFRRLFELVDLGSDVDVNVLSGDRKHELIVQYKETDLAFLCRLAEHHGLSFFFNHEDGSDRVVFTEGLGFPRLASRPRIPHRSRGEHRDIYELEVQTRVIPLTYAIVDYNYRKPLLDLTAAHDAPNGFAGGVAEYGTHVKTPIEAAHFAKMRAEERECQREVFVGKSDVCELTAGAIVEVEGGKQDDLDLLIVEVMHTVRQVTRLHGDGHAGYENSFRAISSKLTYRPPRITPRPRIMGVVNGIIEQREGVSNRYALIDRQGRYLVRFLFDTAAPGERRASRPVRMAQPSAGAGMGMHFPLRPGTEVLMAFVDGDPDRPVILSAIPNAVTPSPVTASNSLKNQIRTTSGVTLEIKDS